MVSIVIKLDLSLVFELTSLSQEVFLFNRLSEVFVVFGEKVEFTNMGPGVEPISHRALSVDTDILASSKQVELVNLLIEMLPVHDVR